MEIDGQVFDEIDGSKKVKVCRKCGSAFTGIFKYVQISEEEKVALTLADHTGLCYKCVGPFIFKASLAELRDKTGLLRSVVKDCEVTYGTIGDKI